MKKIKALFTILFTFICSYHFFAADRPIITELNATGTTGNTINLSWNLPKNPEPKVSKLLIYKSSLPIANYTDISNEKPYAEVDAKNTGFQDTVNDYKDYYYAVLCQTGTTIYDIILPSINSTVNGTHLIIKQKKISKNKAVQAEERLITEGTLRETPLPFLDLTEGKDRKKIQMSEKAKKSVRNLAGTKTKEDSEILTPYVFEEDLIAPEEGDDYLLFEILRRTFIQQNYEGAQKQLEQLLGTNRSENVTKRATFYLGESLYFQQNYKDAVKKLVTVYNDYPAVSKKWIENSLDKIELVDTAD